MAKTEPIAQNFPLAPLRSSSWLLLPVLAAAIIAASLLLPQRQPTPAPAWLVTPFFIALLMVGLLLALRRRRIAIDGHELRIAATFYTRRVAIDALDLEQARIVDLAERTELAPMLKLNGFGLPGFKAGHYLLRNRSRAFCLLTGFERVLVLWQRDDKFILLSPDQPQALLARLRELASAPARR